MFSVNCPICLGDAISPTVLLCAREGCAAVFCHDCIAVWQRTHSDCPVCRRNVGHERQAPNAFVMRELRCSREQLQQQQIALMTQLEAHLISWRQEITHGCELLFLQQSQRLDERLRELGRSRSPRRGAFS